MALLVPILTLVFFLTLAGCTSGPVAQEPTVIPNATAYDDDFWYDPYFDLEEEWASPYAIEYYQGYDYERDRFDWED